MTGGRLRGYPRVVHQKRPRSTQGAAGLARALLAIVITLFTCRAARADVVTLDGLAAPIVRIAIRAGNVTVRTWNRPSVSVEGDPSLSIVRRTMHQAADENTVLIPHAGQPIGAPENDRVASLPAESFVVSTIPAGTHEAVIVRSGTDTPRGPVIVTVPNDAVFVFAAARNGNLDVHDLRRGTFVGFTGRGRLALENVGGTVFAQTGRGALTIADSSLDRLRARSLFGNIVFERCRVRQIEVTSVAGSIVYDDGSFDPGLAHFESVRGDVAIGTQTPAQLGGHVTNDGHVFTNFARGVRVSGNGVDAQAIVGSGGPVVTATTQSGNVYLYDGTIRSRGRLAPAWHLPIATIDRPMRGSAHPPRPNPR